MKCRRTIKHVSCLIILLLLAVGGFPRCAAAIESTSPSPRPNIIFILADDLGYGDLGVTFQNNRKSSSAHFVTPCLDALAREGMLLRNHYSVPVCAPSRGSILLGQHQGDCPIRDNQFDKALPFNHTLATVLKAGGYDTIAIGKWGLQGKTRELTGHPLRHGFDEFFGYLAHMSGHVYYHDAKHPLEEGGKDVTATYGGIYSTDLFTARAKKFIADHTAQKPQTPFFIYLAYTAPHDPQGLPDQPYPQGAGLHGGLQWPIKPNPAMRDKWIDPRYADAYYSTADKSNIPWNNRMKRYATVIDRLDRGVGDIAQLLHDLKIDQNTLIVFTSDNGPSAEGIDPRDFDSWGPFDGFKRDVWEGGVREPTFAVWPGVIKAGQVSTAITATWDWLPTFATLAGLVPPAQADGVSLLPVLLDQPNSFDRRFIYVDYRVHSPPHPGGALGDVFRRKGVTGRDVQQMLRRGDWVAVRTQVRSADDPLRLYNIVADPHEDHNLAADPKYAQMLQQFYKELAWIRRPDASAPRPYDDQMLPAVRADVTSGVMASVFSGDWPWVPNLDVLQPVRTCTVPSIDFNDQSLKIPDHSGVKLEGFLKIPADGVYTFWLTDDDGAQMWLHDAHLIDDDFNHVANTAVTASIPLKAGLHPFHLFYRHATGTPELKLEIAGPQLARMTVPPEMLAVSQKPTEAAHGER